MELPDVDTLYRQYGPIVLRRARAILGDDEAAEDAAQEVFVRVIRKHRAFRGESSPLTWLYSITTHLCLNRLRDSSRRTALAARWLRPPADARSDSPLEVSEHRLTLAKLLPRLPRELAEVAVYYYVDQMAHEEIATLTGLSRRTVGNRLEAFRRAAAEIVESGGGSPS